MSKYQLYGVRHTYVVYNNSGVFGYKRVYMTDETEVKVANGKLEFSGDGQKFTRVYGYQAEGSVMASVDDDQLDGILWPTPAVSPVGGDDFAKRYIKGGDAELQTTFVETRITIDGEDADTGAPIVVRYRILKCQYNPDTPPKIKSEAVHGRQLSWSARRTTADVLGNTPTGMPSRGCFWFKEFVTNTNAFDPVPGDIL